MPCPLAIVFAVTGASTNTLIVSAMLVKHRLRAYPVELRHLRYFVAVAEAGSLLHAAERRLHVSQPSLSRQIRDLEAEVGVPLLERQARGVTLTAAGRVFLDHARLALLQVEAATDGARQTAQPQKPVLSMGFLVGLEVMWLPQLLRILREEAPDVEVTLSTQSSPELALALMRGKLDIAFLRPEKDNEGVIFKMLTKEPLIAVLPAEHHLASRKKIRPQRSRPRDLCQFGKNFSDPARGHTDLRIAGRHHTQGKVRRRKHIIGHVAGGFHGRN